MINKRILSFCLASGMLATSLSAAADVAVQDILLRKKGQDLNVRVVVGNPSGGPQKGPIAVTLFVRPDPGASWQRIKVWNDISSIKSGHKVSRDLFSANSAALRNVAYSNAWQARATITGPGGRSHEKTVTNSGDTR